MIHLIPNTPSQFGYITPFEARKFLSAFTHYLMVFESQATHNTFACVLDVEVDNERYTKFEMGTDSADAANGDVLITESGLYTYSVYGQNSSTNTDPQDVSVVGLCEVGTAKFEDSAAWTIPTVDIPDNVIYYQ
jgi:hypothetical protein